MSHNLAWRASASTTAALPSQPPNRDRRWGRRFGMVSATILLLIPARADISAADIPALRGLSRTNLHEYRSVDGVVKLGRTKAKWELRRREAIAGFLSATGPLPGAEMRGALNLRVEEEVDCGSYVRRLISYESSPGGRVPAYLCIPKRALNGHPAPAVLCLHPTDNTLGHKVVVGLGGRANRQYASELAERGYVTLAPSYPLLANYQPDLKALGFSSGTMKAVWDNIRGLDLLETLPFVKKKAGFATIGHSLGGHNSIFTAVLEPRLKVIVSSCGFDSVLDYYGGNLKGWVQERYILKMSNYLGRPQDVPFDYYELIAALAPRLVFVNAPLKDGNFRWDSVDRIAAAARPVFKLYGVEKNLQVFHPDTEHDFPDAERFAAYEVIAKGLGKP
jgi:dienelactone hydrolase